MEPGTNILPESSFYSYFLLLLAAFASCYCAPKAGTGSCTLLVGWFILGIALLSLPPRFKLYPIRDPIQATRLLSTIPQSPPSPRLLVSITIHNPTHPPPRMPCSHTIIPPLPLLSWRIYRTTSSSPLPLAALNKLMLLLLLRL